MTARYVYPYFFFFLETIPRTTHAAIRTAATTITIIVPGLATCTPIKLIKFTLNLLWRFYFLFLAATTINPIIAMSITAAAAIAIIISWLFLAVKSVEDALPTAC